MANAIKLMVPIINDMFCISDFSEKNGFIDGYLEDINRPSLTNHVFLAFDGNLDTEYKIERDERYRLMKELYKRYTIYISGRPVLLYIFIIIDKDLKRIKEGMMPINEDNILKIHKFWNFTDSFINSLIMMRIQIFDTDLVVPEEDYIPEWNIGE